MAVEGLYRLLFQPPQPIVRPGPGIPVALLRIQVLSQSLLAPPGQPGPRLPPVGTGKFHSGGDGFHASGHLSQTREQIGGLLGAAIDPEGLRGPAEHAVDLGKFFLNAFHRAAGEGQSHSPQRHPLLVRQYAFRAGVAGHSPLLGPQYQQMPTGMAPQRTDAAHLHSIQHRRDGAHIILAEQQPEEPEEVLRLPVGLPQHIIHLLQRRKKNFPQLVQDLGAPIVPGLIHFLGLGLQLFFQTDVLQKSVQGQHLPLQIPGRFKAPAEPRQRLHYRFPQGVQLLQPGLGIPLPFSGQTIRVAFPAG